MCKAYLQVAKPDHLARECGVQQLGGGAVLEQPVVAWGVGGQLGVLPHLHGAVQHPQGLVEAIHCNPSYNQFFV